MLFNPSREHVIRQYDVTPHHAAEVTDRAVAAARWLHERDIGCEAWAVHRSPDGLRVLTVEAWSSTQAYRHAGRLGTLEQPASDVSRYTCAGTGGVSPAPVEDSTAGVVVIDVFRVPRPLLRPATAFTLRNGRGFDQQPGCLSTTVLCGITAGRIATYARWRTVEDFLVAFETMSGTAVDSTDAVNRFAARRTLGLVRTDYHVYDLVDTIDQAGAPR